MTRFVFMCLAAFLFSVPVYAQNTPADLRGTWKDMSVDERRDTLDALKEKRQTRREEWKNLSPEERAAKKAAAKDKWDSLTPEQKEKAKQARQNHLDRKEKRIDRRMDRVKDR